MTKKQKNYFSVLSRVSIFVMVLTILFGSGKSLLSPLTVRGSNQVVEGSITWTTSNSTKTSHTSYNKSFSISTSRGTNVHLFSTGYWEPTNPQLIDTKTCGSERKRNKCSQKEQHGQQGRNRNSGFAVPECPGTAAEMMIICLYDLISQSLERC